MGPSWRTVAGAVILFGVGAGSAALCAEDTGWRQPGVRAWYVGVTNGDWSEGDAEEAYVIDRLEGAGFRIVKHAAVGFWDAPIPSNVLTAPNPTSEGPFWISPQRLRALQGPPALEDVIWQGLNLHVKARVTYQRADDLPFYAFLPVQALYQAGAPRDLITLSGENEGVLGDYFFDVETGLGLGSSLYVPGFYMLMVLSEINYDFAMHRAFAEDGGPHSAYRGVQFTPGVGQYYRFEEQTISRYRRSVFAQLLLTLSNVTNGQFVHEMYSNWFDGENRQSWIGPPLGASTRATAAPAASWTGNGTNTFFWVPPADFARGGIRVWDLDMTRRDPVAGDVVFASDQSPGAWGLTRLQLDPDGFPREMTIRAPSMGILIDSSTVPPDSKQNTNTGRDYYLGTMGRAIPTCPCALTPAGRTHPAAADSGTVTVTTGSGCAWVASAVDTWLHTSSSGTGSGTVSYLVDANAGEARTGTLAVAGQAFTVAQLGAAGTCSCTLTPAGRTHSATADAGTFTVTIGNGCAWTAATTDAWLHTTSSGTGPGTVEYLVDANPGPSRSGTLTVAGQTFTVDQTGGPGMHDLGIMKLEVPGRITLKRSGRPATRKVKLSIQNHGAQPETISSATALAQLVTLAVESLGTCPSPPATIHAPGRYPLTIGPKKKRTVMFSVTYDCANDPLASSKTAAHWDYRYLAELHGTADTDAHDDICPHDGPPSGVDPVNRKVRDKGCGGRRWGKTRGADVFTDVVSR